MPYQVRGSDLGPAVKLRFARLERTARCNRRCRPGVEANPEGSCATGSRALRRECEMEQACIARDGFGCKAAGGDIAVPWFAFKRRGSEALAAADAIRAN